MNALPTALMETTASTLFHGLWQGVLIAALLATLLRAMRQRSAEARYAASVTALIALAVTVSVTFAVLWEGPLTTPSASGVSEELPALPAAAEALLPIIGGTERIEVSEALRRFAPAVVAIWFAGVFVFSLRLGIGYLRVMELVREATVKAESEWNLALTRVARRIGLQRPVRLLHSARVEVPTVIGVMRPVILVPLSALSGLTPEQIETIVAHELAHIRRHDYLVNLMQSAIETLLFYNPAVWWISRQVRIERENCCDDLAVAVCGDRLLYARALTELEELRAIARPGLAATGGSLLGRIRRIVTGDDVRHAHAGWLVVLGALTVLGAAAFAAPSRSAEDATSQPGVAMFWPADSAVAHVVAAIAASSSIGGGAPGGEGPSAVVVEEEPEPAEGRATRNRERASASAGRSEAGDESRFHASFASSFDHNVLHVRRDGFAYQVASLAQQGETVTVRGARGEADGDERPVIDGLTIDDLIRLRNLGVDAEYVRAMREAGYDLPLEQLEGFRAVGVTPDYIRSLRAAGYGDLAPEELQSLRAVGVSAAYIQELGELGIRNLPSNEIMSLKAVGVSPAYVAAMRKLFDDDLDAGELMQMRAVGVGPDFAAAMKAAGYARLEADDLIELRAVGVNPEYIAALRAAGYAKAELDEIVAARAVGVSPAYLDEMARFGIRDLDLDEVISLRAVGVTPGWIREMAEAGYPDLDSDQMQQLRAIGVTARWIGELAEMGYRDLDLDAIQQLRGLGVTAAWIRDLGEAGIRDLTIDEMIRLRSSGIDGTFIRRMKESRSGN
ncbi:MAG TPA: M56 family metallopeptidase [Thermoanaerobaculia bacterium]|nr:M56 family metallopeptidase [Thermoanaerobaculia bacterium]